MPTLISHRNRFVFIHINKAGGTSVASLLAEYEEWRFCKRLYRAVERRYLPRKYRAVKLFGQHFVGSHASAAMVRDTLGQSRYDRYFKFAVVRNPWSREVSRYFFARKTPTHHLHRLASELEFADFIRRRGEKTSARDVSSYQFKKVSDASGRLIVDTIVRLENLEQELPPVLETIGIDPAVQVPRLNASSHGPYQQYYDDESRDIVARYSRDDIEQFGYRFD